MNRVNKVIRPVLLCSLVALSGCFSLSRNAPPQQYYVLGSGGGTAAALDAGTEPIRVPVGLRATRLADYLATPFIVVRRGTSRIEFSEFDRWGEDLARAVNRSLAGHMAARDPSRKVEVAPWPMGSQPGFVIQVHLHRFEGAAPETMDDPVGEAHLLATWEILDPIDGALRSRGSTEVRRPGWTVGDFNALVELLDAGLGVLAEDLVRALEGVPQP